MKNLSKLLLLGALIGSVEVNALEKPETPDINPETRSLEHDVDILKAQGKLGPRATIARQAATKQLSQRYLELGLKANKTEAEKKEFQEIGAELKNRLGTAVGSLTQSIQ